MDGDAVTGCLLVLFLYDVADAILLDDLRERIGAPPPGREPPFRQPAPQYVGFANPPVIEHLPPVTFPGGEKASPRIVYYDYGVAAIQFEIGFQGSWQDAVSLAARWMNTPELEQQAAGMIRDHAARAGPALVKPYRERLSEDYYIVHIHNSAGAPAGNLIERHAHHIAQIVRGEKAQFSASELAEILEPRVSYYENDLLVVGWSAALVYDSVEGAAPTIQLLEYANAQLLEFRHYDGILTALLSTVYRSLERGGGLWGRWRLAREAEHLNTIRLDVRELTERMDNSIKFLSDMFAARLYRMAAAKIGVPDYRTLVDQKLESAGELYSFMMDRFYQGRGFVLELMVVIILVIELVFLFRGTK